MGLKKIFIRIACILCILSAVFSLPGCANKSVGKNSRKPRYAPLQPVKIIAIKFKRKTPVNKSANFFLDCFKLFTIKHIMLDNPQSKYPANKLGLYGFKVPYALEIISSELILVVSCHPEISLTPDIFWIKAIIDS